jgi:hypothetical protein
VKLLKPPIHLDQSLPHRRHRLLKHTNRERPPIMRRWAVLTTGLLLISVPMFGQSTVGDWIADAHTGCKVWDANPQPNESVTWSCACQNGLAQGRGVLDWFQDGKPSEHGEGEWRDGMRTGYGMYAMANGERYDGAWQDGSKNGHGVKIWADGSRYDGGWLDNKRHGRGAEVLADGSRYDGEWRDDRPDGLGTAVWPNGTTVTGTWVNGCFRGGDRTAAFGVALSSCQ